MKQTIILSAYNIHHGGGAILLTDLLKAFKNFKELKVFIFIDERFILEQVFSTVSHFIIKRVKPTIFERLKAELLIKRLNNSSNFLLCFGNLPPLFISNINTYVYVQNKYLISKNFVCFYNFKTIIRTILEKLWFSLFKKRHYTYIVQTPSMLNLFSQVYNNYECIICGFAPSVRIRENKNNLNLNNSNKKFIYVASGEPHKNHKILILSWIELHKKDIRPELFLILSKTKYLNLYSWINKKIKDNHLNIKLFSDLSHQEVLSLYKKSNALIFPSLMESFGLPLLEAQSCNLDIIASDLDYVRDIVIPKETFCANSYISIARSVMRYLNISEHKELCSASEFIQILMSHNNE